MLHILTLSVIGVVLRHPELMNNQLSPGGPHFPGTGLDHPSVSVLPSQSSPEALPDQNQVNVLGGKPYFPPNRNYDYREYIM